MHFILPSVLIASAVYSSQPSGFKSILRRAASNQACPAATASGQGMALDLGLAVNYAIYSKTNIADSVPGTASAHIYGDIGVGPIAMTAITGFALTSVSASDDSAKSVYVSGSVYGPRHPIAGKSATTGDVASDIVSAYNCGKSYAALTSNTVAGAGSLDGRHFVPGVYKWGGAVSLGVSGKVYLDGNYGDVFIFNAAGAISAGASSEIVLGGTLTSASVYWVGSTVLTTGDKSIFRGIILTGTNVVIAGTLDGAVLAQTDVALDSATITLPITPTPSVCADGTARQGSSSDCSPCPPSTYSTGGSICQSYSYARFASFDCDQGPLNNFHGSQATDWIGDNYVDGNRVPALPMNNNPGFVNASEGFCESTCQSLFPNPKNVNTGYQGFVHVPYTSDEAVTRKAQIASEQRTTFPVTPFQVYCKINSAGAALTRSSYRSCNLLGRCSQYKNLITNYINTYGLEGAPECQNVAYSSQTQACIASDGSPCTKSLP